MVPSPRNRRSSVKSHPMKDLNSSGDSLSLSQEEGNKGKDSKFGSLYVRTISGAAFVLLFITIISLGHLYCLGLLLCLQVSLPPPSVSVTFSRSLFETFRLLNTKLL